MNRQRSLVLLVVSLGLLFLAVPRLTRAMPPPGGVKCFLFPGVCGTVPPPPGQTNPVQRMQVIFHSANDLNNPTLCDRLKSIPVGDYNLAGYVNPVTEAFVGQSVAVSLLVWLKDNQSAGLPLPLLPGQDPRAVASWLGYPTKNFGPGSIQWLNNNNQGYDAVCSYFNTPGSSSNFNNAADPFTGQGSGYELDGQRLDNNNGRPSLVLTLRLSNLPAPQDGSSNTAFTSNSFIYDRANSGDGTYHQLDEAFSSFNLKQIQQAVNIASGDVAVKNGFGDNRILLTNTNGQTLVTQNKLTNCAWVNPALNERCLSNNTNYVGLYLSSLSSTANLNQAKVELQKTLSKVAQEKAEINISNDPNEINGRISSFLSRESNIWLHPRGEVLIISSDLNNLSVDLPDTSNLIVKGRKLLVFSFNNPGFQVDWRDYPTYNGSGQNKLAVISLSGNQTLSGNTDPAGSRRFDGAYIATSLSGRTDNRITIGGTGQDYPPVTINGLLMADQISVTRQVNPADSTIATINYDPSFQNGGLLGLSPFIRPLVSEGGNQ